MLFCSDVKTSRDTTTHARGRGAGGRGAGGRGRGASTRGGRERTPGSKNSSLITSTGLFSEGAGDGMNKRTMSNRIRGANDGDSSQLRRPTIIKKEKVDPVAEQKQIRDIYELDSEPMDDESAADDGPMPINLIPSKSTLRSSMFQRLYSNNIFSISQTNKN